MIPRALKLLLDGGRSGNTDEVKLQQLGYRQDLPRRLTALNNAGCTVGVLSVFAVAGSLGDIGLTYGGEVVAVWGWLGVSLLNVVVALCMAELMSAYPCSGGIYYWSFVLAPSSVRARVCWLTGWLNLLGHISFTTGLVSTFTNCICTQIYIMTGGAVSCTHWHQFLVFAAILVVCATLNSLTQGFVALMTTCSLVWHLVGGTVFIVCLPCISAHINSNAQVWTQWEPNTELHGISSPAYIALYGLLLSQWIIMSYDSSVNLAEETIDAECGGALALVGSVLVASVMGFGLILSLMYTMLDLKSTLSASNASGGTDAMAQIVWNVMQGRYKQGRYGTLPLMIIPLVALFFCCFSAITSNSRMIYAFSRDGAMLGSRTWRTLHPTTHMPVTAVWGCAGMTLILGVPVMFNDQMFHAISSTSVVCLFLSYLVPFSLRLYAARGVHVAGVFSLGRLTWPLFMTSILWMSFASVLFLLPAEYPITAENANYTIFLLLGVIGLAWLLWVAPGCGGRTWFAGPKASLGQAGAEALEAAAAAAGPPSKGPSSLVMGFWNRSVTQRLPGHLQRLKGSVTGSSTGHEGSTLGSVRGSGTWSLLTWWRRRATLRQSQVSGADMGTDQHGGEVLLALHGVAEPIREVAEDEEMEDGSVGSRASPGWSAPFARPSNEINSGSQHTRRSSQQPRSSHDNASRLPAAHSATYWAGLAATSVSTPARPGSLAATSASMPARSLLRSSSVRNSSPSMLQELLVSEGLIPPDAIHTSVAPSIPSGSMSTMRAPRSGSHAMRSGHRASSTSGDSHVGTFSPGARRGSSVYM